MELYKSWLTTKGYKFNTINIYVRHLKIFTTYLSDIGQELSTISHNEVLAFVNYLKLNSNSINDANRKLRSVYKYYEYLQQTNQFGSNPINGMYLKGIVRKKVSSLLTKEELDELYDVYPTDTVIHQKNKVLLGLVIYQGASTSDLHQLKLSDIGLEKGVITLSGHQPRTLALEGFQIVGMLNYLHTLRPNIIKGLKQSCKFKKAGRKPKRIDYKLLKEQLFISDQGSTNLKPSILHLCRDLKAINGNVKNLVHLRQSVISCWLMQHDIRKVQYQAGHRYVSSTERYQRHNLQTLTALLTEYHPLE